MATYNRNRIMPPPLKDLSPSTTCPCCQKTILSNGQYEGVNVINDNALAYALLAWNLSANESLPYEEVITWCPACLDDFADPDKKKALILKYQLKKG